MSTPSKGRTSNSRTMTIPLSGYFDDGQWLCNCKPRKPAARFQVKKSGPNTGKWFFTCQEPKDQSCNFFLWEDKAKNREKRAVMSNSRTEPISNLGTPVASISKNPPSAGKSFEEHMRGSGRQKLGKTIVKDEDEEFDWLLSTEEERILDDAVSRASVEVDTPRSSFTETPRKSLRTDLLDTPGSKRKWGFEGTYPTPETSTRFSSLGEDVFTNSSTTQGSLHYDMKKTKSFSPLGTPTRNRFRDATSTVMNDSLNSPSSNSAVQDYELTEEVMDLLESQNINEGVTSKLRTVLNRYALKSKGISRGREITREALKDKEGKIVELQERIREMEIEREMDRLVIKKLRGELGNGMVDY